MGKRSMFDRSPKAIRRQVESSKKYERQLEKKNTWVQCVCTHSVDRLHAIEGGNGNEKKFRCECGKILTISKITAEEADQAFKTMDRIIDLLKMRSDLNADETILDHLANFQYQSIYVHQLYLDFLNASRKKRSGFNSQKENPGFMNTDPNKSVF